MRKIRNESIRSHLLWPLLALLIIQAAVIGGIIFFGGVSTRIKSNEIHILSENTENAKLYLEKETIHQWVNLVGDSGSMSAEIQELLEANNKKPSDIKMDYSLNGLIAEGVLEKSIDVLRRSYATGIFLVLDGPAAINSPENTRAGFYIRDNNAGRYSQDYSSLLMERGLPSIAEKYNIPLDSFWELGFSLEDKNSSSAFFNKPFYSAVENGAKAAEFQNYTYLAPPFRLSPKDTEVVTYSVPVILKDGTVAGVFGIEITLARLEKLLASDKDSGSITDNFVLGIKKAGEESFVPVANSGYLFNQYFNDQPKLSYTYQEEEGIGSLNSKDNTKWYVSVKNLEVYSYETPFAEDQWILAGMARQNDLLSFYNSIRRRLLGAILVPILLSILGAFLIGKVVTDPIRKLLEELRKKSGERGLTLNRVNIQEIDLLSETIEQLSADVERSASKISSILEYANVLIGVFEYKDNSDQVFCSRSLFEMLGWETGEEPYCYISKAEFTEKMSEVFDDLTFKYNQKYYPVDIEGKRRWIELVIDDNEEGTLLGVCTDVTVDIEEKKKLERERNYDLLTELYNRRAFREKTGAFLSSGFNGTAAVVMWDLDNLKYINDTYGHDKGDRYIVLFADCLKQLIKDGAIVSRYSGDEFVTLIYSRFGKEEIRERINKFTDILQNSKLELEGGYRIPIRVSGGLAWYPDDSRIFDTLLNYADFAMYTVKHSVKGIVMEFDPLTYSDNAYMLDGREELNHMLETRKVKFAFQPIVRRDGTLYGYELLMRPDFVKIKGVEEALNLARAQAKLPQMEALTWFAGMEAIEKQNSLGMLGTEEKLFINSIASVCMSEKDQQDLEDNYGKWMHRVVMEITEGDPSSEECEKKKIRCIRKYKGLVAIDDFGSGYNSESALLNMEPDIVKMDMDLVRHIHKDTNRQIILRNLIDFSKRNHIEILAEGVETAEELEYLIESGVHLFQGYYIARPHIEIRPLDPFVVNKMMDIEKKTKK